MKSPARDGESDGGRGRGPPPREPVRGQGVSLAGPADRCRAPSWWRQVRPTGPCTCPHRPTDPDTPGTPRPRLRWGRGRRPDGPRRPLAARRATSPAAPTAGRGRPPVRRPGLPDAVLVPPRRADHRASRRPSSASCPASARGVRCRLAFALLLSVGAAARARPRPRRPAVGLPVRRISLDAARRLHRDRRRPHARAEPARRWPARWCRCCSAPSAGLVAQATEPGTVAQLLACRARA